MRADRRNDERVDIRNENGAIGGERVGGGTRWCSDNDSVSAEGGCELIVKADTEIAHAGDCAFCH